MLKGYIEKINSEEFYINIEFWGYGNLNIIEALKLEGVNLEKDINDLKPGDRKYYNF